MRREFCPNTLKMGKFKRKRIIFPKFAQSQLSKGQVGRKQKRKGAAAAAGGFVSSSLFNSKGFYIGLGMAG